MTGRRKIVLGSRGSALALWQTNHVRDLLCRMAPQYDYEIEVIRTKGDKILDVALSKIGDKGLFTKELERKLLDGRVDICVHSMKDMPTELPAGLAILGVPARANPRDALVAGKPGVRLANLPAGARVATGSLRRVAQLGRLRPDVVACEIRGNVDSRVRRVMDGEFDAAILAAAGLERLGMEDRISSQFDTCEMIPAVAQGTIAVEAREDDAEVRTLCELICDKPTRIAVEAERYVLRALQGGCQVPMGAHAQVTDDGAFAIDAFVSSLDGSRFLRAHAAGPAEGSQQAAANAVDQLLSQGAEEILKELR